MTSGSLYWPDLVFFHVPVLYDLSESRPNRTEQEEESDDNGGFPYGKALVNDNPVIQ